LDRIGIAFGTTKPCPISVIIGIVGNAASILLTALLVISRLIAPREQVSSVLALTALTPAFQTLSDQKNWQKGSSGRHT
jgi:hypothetical protein